MSGAYRDNSVTLHHGDCLDVLRSLPDASVDAVITDPPYGLSDLKPAQVTKAIVAWASGDRENVPDARGFMGRSWDAFVPPPAVWDECYRVLKPGGHIAAFAGTRTMDLMGLSIRLAGFEIRDGLQWLYGSGFPKSMDVSKAIDKAGGDPLSFRRFARTYAAAVEASEHTHTDIDRHLGIKSSSCYWAREDHRGGLPPRHHWEQVRDLLALDASIEQLYDEAEREITQEQKRPFVSGEVISFDQRSSTERERRDIPATDTAREWSGWGTALKPAHEPIVCAQKPFNAVPSWDVVNTLHHALGGLLWLSASPAKRAELSSTSSPHALPEDACASALADAVLGTSRGKSATTATFNSQALASTSSNIATSWSAILAALSGQTRTFTTATASSTTTALQTLNSLLAPITSPTTMPRCACLTGGTTSPAQSADDSSSVAWARWRHTQSASAPESAIEGIALAVSSALASVAEQLSNEQAAASTAQQSAQTGPPMSGDSSLSGLASAAGSSSSLAETLAASVRSTAQGSPSTAGSRPAHEPIVLARKPLAGTVAANVLQFGTGALNIDATRVGGELITAHGGGRSGDRIYGGGKGMPAIEAGSNPHRGRWPANVLLTHAPDCDDSACQPGCPVAELDAQSGTLKSGANPTRRSSDKFRDAYGEFKGQEVCTPARGADQGGASRFFPSFRYQAKAPTSERPKVNGIAHPTAKPLAVMSWLVKLLVSPGGTVLEPFAGSGTTVEACIDEGFHVIAVEREAEYLPLIQHRIDRANQRQAAQPAASDPGLFDLEPTEVA